MKNDISLFNIFIEVCENFANRPALACGSIVLTYENLLKEVLSRSHSANPSAIVVLRESNKMEVVISMLVALKEANPFLYISPKLPKFRVEQILQEIEGKAFPGIAYVIYTSGSTGQPKGILIGAEALNNFVIAINQAVPIYPEDRILQHSSFAFDASIWEVFATLFRGACLVLPPDEMVLSGHYLASFMQKNLITGLLLTPVLANSIIDFDLTPLRFLIVGGEAFPLQILAKWQGDFDLYNAYGPTECTVCVSVHKCKQGQDRIPLGRALKGCKLAVSNDNELLVQGIQIAEGYLNNEALTKTKFKDGTYCTGDLVAADEDGNLFFTGRMDKQIKLHGLRIEKGDIESAVMKMSGVKNAVVDVENDILELFVHTERSSHEILIFLENVLPNYMVPQRIVVLQEFPLNLQGKVDLAAMKNVSRGPKPNLELDLKVVLENLWKEILKINQVSLQTHFFEVGGDSLQLLTIINQIHEKTGVMLDFGKAFAFPVFQDQLATISDALCQM